MRLLRRSAGRAIQFEAFGVTAEVAYGGRELEAQVREVLPPGWVATRGGPLSGRFGLEQGRSGDFAVSAGDRPLIEGVTLTVALGLLDSEIRLLVATMAPDLFFVHAGVVALDRRALLVPGQSFTGKTTLVRALVEAGATYYSDEYAVLDRDGMVHPYPRRLSIRATDSSPAEEPHVHELGGVAGESAADVALVAITRYRAGETWNPQPLSNGAGALALLENTVPARARPQDALQVISRALRRARVLAGDRGEATEAVNALLAELAPSAGRGTHP